MPACGSPSTAAGPRSAQSPGLTLLQFVIDGLLLLQYCTAAFEAAANLTYGDHRIVYSYISFAAAFEAAVNLTSVIVVLFIVTFHSKILLIRGSESELMVADHVCVVNAIFIVTNLFC